METPASPTSGEMLCAIFLYSLFSSSEVKVWPDATSRWKIGHQSLAAGYRPRHNDPGVPKLCGQAKRFVRGGLALSQGEENAMPTKEGVARELARQHYLIETGTRRLQRTLGSPAVALRCASLRLPPCWRS